MDGVPIRPPSGGVITVTRLDLELGAAERAEAAAGRMHAELEADVGVDQAAERDDPPVVARRGRTEASGRPCVWRPLKSTAPVPTPSASSRRVRRDHRDEHLGDQLLVELSGLDPQVGAVLAAAPGGERVNASPRSGATPVISRPATRSRSPMSISSARVERVGAGHLLAHDRPQRLRLAVGRLEQQLVVDLQHQPRPPALVAQAPVAADHRHLDDVGGAALHDGVHGQPLAQAAGLVVAPPAARGSAAAARTAWSRSRAPWPTRSPSR